MSRARLYLDVDGVINASQAMGWGKLKKGPARSGGMTWRITWAPAMIEELRQLDVELVWTTTWRDDALKSIAPLIGWGEHGRVLHPIAPPGNQPSIYWKVVSVAQDQRESKTPFIWIDDELTDLEPHEFVGLTPRPTALLLSPNPLTGISPRHISKIKNWLDSLEEAA